jgi:hypothetical protein
VAAEPTVGSHGTNDLRGPPPPAKGLMGPIGSVLPMRGPRSQFSLFRVNFNFNGRRRHELPRVFGSLSTSGAAPA